MLYLRQLRHSLSERSFHGFRSYSRPHLNATLPRGREVRQLIVEVLNGQAETQFSQLSDGVARQVGECQPTKAAYLARALAADAGPAENIGFGRSSRVCVEYPP